MGSVQSWALEMTQKVGTRNNQILMHECETVKVVRVFVGICIYLVHRLIM